MRVRFAPSMLLLGIIGPARMVMAQSTGTSTPAGAPNTARSAESHMTAGYAKLPMSFEPCFEAMCAEAGSQAKYFARGSGYLLFLTSTEAVTRCGPQQGIHSAYEAARVELKGLNRGDGSSPRQE